MRIEVLAQHILQSVGNGAQLVPHVLLVRVARVSDRLLFERWKKRVSSSAYTLGVTHVTPYTRAVCTIKEARRATKPRRRSLGSFAAATLA
jgi:hypothetical protein